MADYQKLKKLDESSAKKMKEGSGPADECICTLLSPPGGPNVMQAVRASVKRALSIPKRAFSSKIPSGRQKAVIKNGTMPGKVLKSTKEAMKRGKKCGKCGCDDHDVIMKTSYANIRIATPDITSICPCPTPACMPDKEKYHNLDVTLEHVQIVPEIMNAKSTASNHTGESTPADHRLPSYPTSLTTSQMTGQSLAPSDHSVKDDSRNDE